MKSILTFTVIIFSLICSACSNDNPLYINNATDKQLSITPLSSSLNVGTSEQYQALLIDEDGRQVDVTTQAQWETSSEQIATINSNAVVVAATEGAVVISATYDALIAKASLAVTNKTPVSLSVTPIESVTLVGLTQQLYSIVRFDDGTSQDVTRDTQWSSGDVSVALIGPSNGLINGLTTGGPVVMTANFSGLTNTATIEVLNATVDSMKIDPANTVLPVGSLQQFSATIFLNTTPVEKIDVTEDVNWTVANDNFAIIGNQDFNRGLLQARAEGSTNVIASLDYAGTTINSTATLEVSPVALQRITVSPQDISVIRGTVGQFNAIGFYSDGSEQDITLSAIWTSLNTSVGSVVATGAQAGSAYAINPGMTTITAELLSFSASSIVNVTAPQLESIRVTPEDPSVPLGLTQVFSAIGYFSDGTAQDISKLAAWTSSDSNVAELNPRLAGSAMTVTSGVTSIVASFQGISSSSELTVVAPSLISISITPVQISLPRNLDFNYQAFGNYSNSIEVDITESVTWSSLDASIATISNGIGSEGRTHTLSGGTTVITAEDPTTGFTANADLEVFSGYTTFITPSCSPISISVGDVVQCGCIGHLSSSSETYDCTPVATFTPQPAGYIEFSTKAGEEGQAIGISAGGTNVYISAGGPSGNRSVTVE